MPVSKRSGSYRSIDHTFGGSRPAENYNTRYCHQFTRDFARQKCVQEFELGHEKRMLKKINGGGSGGGGGGGNGKSSPPNESMKYYVGNSKYTSRPPTGVDLALGLNGYKDMTPVRPARVPSSLKPLDEFKDPTISKPYQSRFFRYFPIYIFLLNLIKLLIHYCFR